MKKIVSTLLLTLCVFTVFSQTDMAYEMKSYDWEETPVPTVINEEEAKASVVITKDFLVKEYMYYMGMLFEVSTIHKKKILNNDEAVDQSNKVYISTGRGQEVIGLKARSIAKDGKVTVFNNDNIKYVENYEDAGPYTIFALEGVEKGSEIEFMYTLKTVINDFNCNDYTLNNTYPVRNAHFELIYDKAWVFLTKSYNGLPEAKFDTTVSGKNRHTVEVLSSPSIDDEIFSYGKAAYKRMEYKFSKNKDNNRGESNTFDDFAKDYYHYFYETTDEKKYKKEVKAVQKMLKSLALENLNEEDKIRKIEEHIKSFTQDGNYGKILVNEIISSKSVIAPWAFCRMFAFALDQAGIEHQLVVTSDRSDKRFDGDFQSWSYLQDFLFYFPQHEKYLSPTNQAYRYGLVPENLCYNGGLFIKFISLGDIKSPVARVGYIEGPVDSLSYSNMDITITFEDGFTGVDLVARMDGTGYSSIGIFAAYKLLSDENKEEICKSSLKVMAEDAEVKESSMDPIPEGGDILKKVYTVRGKVHSTALIEKAGLNYSFDIGKVIGPQAEMYEDKERMTDIENDNNHGYIRVLRVVVPEGYVITNINDIVMDVFVEKNGKRTMSFKSSYVKEGNTYIITVHEFYNEIRVSKSEFESFRKVINAAADFNKKHLVFEKKK
jgi:hypothetical protein